MNKEFAANPTLLHYRIVSKIGAGGMGEVYLAQDTSELGRTVALKIISAEVAKDKDRLQRFTQEARTVSNLNHPNILTVHEFGQTESVSFIATEFVDGVTLRQHLSNRRLKLIDVLDVAIQIVAALNAAHEAGVTHRDLKPENVMVRKDHIVKVLDFGLAKLSEPPALADGSDAEAATKVPISIAWVDDALVFCRAVLPIPVVGQFEVRQALACPNLNDKLKFVLHLNSNGPTSPIPNRFRCKEDCVKVRNEE